MKAIAKIVLGLSVSFCFSGAALWAQEAPKAAGARVVTVNIINADGQSVGTAVLTPAAHGGVKILLDIRKLPPGTHLMHIHQNGVCTPPDFKSAGAHFNPGGMDHDGHAAGAMAGDIPHFELTVGADGTAHTTTVAPGVTMGSEPNSVFADSGTSLVIHAVEEHVTESAPPRIACGVISKPK